MTGLPVQIGRSSLKVSAVPVKCGSKQPRDPRSVGCSGRMRTQTTELSAKCRLFQPNAEANNRENREVSVVPDERGCKQPREPRSVGCSSRTRKQTTERIAKCRCSGRTQMQTTERTAKCRLFQPNADANSRYSS